MEVTNMEGVEGDEVLEECVQALVAMDSGPVGSALYIVHYAEFAEGYRGAAQCVVDVLRSRHFLTPEAIEQLKREGL